eukprot:Platyproteum_vivax@DN11003_c0_g1_i1.p2
MHLSATKICDEEASSPLLQLLCQKINDLQMELAETKDQVQNCNQTIKELVVEAAETKQTLTKNIEELLQIKEEVRDLERNLLKSQCIALLEFKWNEEGNVREVHLCEDGTS